MTLQLTDQPDPDDIKQLDDRINEFNFETTGLHDGRLLAILEKDDQGELIAGLYGWTWGGCAEVRYLWVRADQRRQGWGQRLLQAAEQEALSRGCEQIVLGTHSFQAPGFYQKLGYKIVGQFADYPRGYQQLFLCKRLG